MKKIVTKEFEFAGKKLTLETGKWVKQATSAVVARMGDTTVLATVVASSKEVVQDFFPLTVDYMEKLYAGGKIRGSRWVKREDTKSDALTLTGRLIDRSIRPLFPKEYRKEVQVVATLLSTDGEVEGDILALVAVSAALASSGLPWKGPIGGVRVGYVNGKLVINPGKDDRTHSELDLVVSQTEEKTVMLEAGAKQLDDAIVLEGVTQAHEENKKLISFIQDFAKEVGVAAMPVPADEAVVEFISRIDKEYSKEVDQLIKDAAEKEGSGSNMEKMVDTMYDAWKEKEPTAEIDKKLIARALEKVFFKHIRKHTLETGIRPDGRKIDEIRAIDISIDVLPRVHGSAVFQRGDTQILSVATLGSSRMAQLVESVEGEISKRYMHHYFFPPYSTGETGKMDRLSRREIGHGALAERALEAVIPSEDVFPYTIRVVSDTLGSNGSTSMASTCGSTLALMLAGVPILAPVAGIAIGRVQDGDKYVLLTDILGLEDFSGDMDFKVTGSKNGITAIQLDVKDAGLTIAQVGEVFERAKTARLTILDKMLAVIAEPRKTVSQYAPRITKIKVPEDKIGEVIGPGGRMIKEIMAKTQTQLDMDDDGTLTITGATDEGVKAAVDWIGGMAKVVTAGEVFENAEVKRILPFGAFVEFLPGQEGMVHVSQMSTQFVNNPEEVVQVGDKVKVHVLEVDQQGRINLSMLFDESGAPIERKSPERSSGPRPFTPRGGGDRGPRSFAPRDGGRSFDRGNIGDRGEGHPLSRQLRKEGGNRGFKRNDNRY